MAGVLFYHTTTYYNCWLEAELEGVSFNIDIEFIPGLQINWFGSRVETFDNVCLVPLCETRSAAALIDRTPKICTHHNTAAIVYRQYAKHCPIEAGQGVQEKVDMTWFCTI